MLYKRLKDIEFPWTYEQLMKLPIFMKEEAYRNMDEFIEEDNKMMKAMQKRGGM